MGIHYLPEIMYKKKNKAQSLFFLE
jgi:hypothetical protein